MKTATAQPQKGYYIGLLNGWQIERICLRDMTLEEAQRSMQMFNDLLHGTRQHAVIVQPISDTILKVTSKDYKSA